jgi:AcrR family transcriptional regulator
MEREQILDTAAELFTRYGYRATSLDKVAKRLGVTKAALYHYYRSKGEILYEIHLRVVTQHLEMMTPIVRSDLPAAEKLRRVIRAHIDALLRHLPRVTVFFREGHELPPRYARKIALRSREYTALVQDLVESGIKEGAFRKLDPQIVAFSILALCNSLYHWYDPQGRVFPAELADLYVELLSRGYLKAPE